MTNPIIANSNGHLNRRAVVAAGALGAAALLGAGTAVAKVGEDAELLELFEDWKDQALAAYDAVVRLTGRDFAAEAEMI